MPDPGDKQRINALVAEHVMCECRHVWKSVEPWDYGFDDMCDKCNQRSVLRPPVVGTDHDYLTWDGAGRVEAKMRELGWRLDACVHYDGTADADFIHPEKPWGEAAGKNFPHAVAVAALRALGVEG